MLYPTGLGIDLGKFVLGDADNTSVAVKQNGARRGRALIEGENVLLFHTLLHNANLTGRHG